MAQRLAVTSFAGLLGSALFSLPLAAHAQQVTTADYQAAAALLEVNLRGLVANQSIEPHWIGNRGAFWYRRDEADGVSYLRFDPKSKTKTPLFDHAALAAAIGPVLGAGANTPSSHQMGLTGVVVSADLTTLTGHAGPKLITCTLVAPSCQASEPKPAEPGLLPSPDGKRAVLVQNHNLVIRDLASGKDAALTTDGAPYYSYGTLTDQSLITITMRKTNMVLPPMGVSWSPDGRYLVASRADERKVRVNPFVEWVPQDGSRRPVYHEIRSAFTGDREQVEAQLFVFEVATGNATPIRPPASHPALSPDPAGWSVSRGQVFLVARAPGSRSIALLRVGLATGAVATVLEEALPTKVETNTVEYDVPNVRILADGAEAIWYSARSGWGHLYRYDAQTGALLNPITAGDWAVLDILTTDERRREVYFTAGGREPNRDPYYRHVYKARLDGGAPTLLTDANADHHFDPPRSPYLKLLFRAADPPPLIQLEAGVFVDTYSTVETPPVTVLRSTIDGRQIAELERADASKLFAAGWHPPVRERVKAADGTTDLYAVYYAPSRALGTAKHPVIDAVYGGPQVIVTPKNFIEAYSATNPLGESGLARLGFAMVTVDGRGTPNRSREFRDAGYVEFTRVGIEDHIATIRQLAARHPEMDTTRVGIYGWSWGGTFSAQAILSHPEFYDVAVSGAGVYDYAALYGGFENFTSPAQYADGSTYRTKPDESPANWKPLDITAMAPNLRGHLMIIYGDLDENVPSSQAFRLAAALVKANKPYDLLYLPGRTHAGAGDPYTIRRTWDYFVERLLGETPVPDVTVTFRPVTPP